MHEITEIGNRTVENSGVEDCLELAEDLLLDLKEKDLPSGRVISMPIDKISTLGAGVASLLPVFNRIELPSIPEGRGYYQIINQGAGEVLNTTKAGKTYGILKSPDGASHFAQLKEVVPDKANNIAKIKPNPALMMMTVALYSIEEKLDVIEKQGANILSFIETEKKAEVESDIEALNDILKKFKFNWDSDLFVKSNHKLVCDIQRTARKNIHFYQDSIEKSINKKSQMFGNEKVGDKLIKLKDDFNYYRLSLYAFSLASMEEIMLSGNYSEDNILANLESIRKYTDKYREIYSECSVFLDKLSQGSLGVNLLNGVGAVSNSFGKIIGSIPIVKEGSVDELLQDKGEKLKETASNITQDVLETFGKVSNPNNDVIMDKLDEMNMIHNKTQQIYVDKNRIYLVAS